MSFWERLRTFLGLPAFRSSTRRFELDESVLYSLQELAQREQLPTQTLAERLLRQAIQERALNDDAHHRWRALTPREQEIAALICLDYTTREIASRLAISPETIKTHAHNLLAKFGTRNRKELRVLLADWDFSRWER